jgi:hypothetical protein
MRERLASTARQQAAAGAGPVEANDDVVRKLYFSNAVASVSCDAAAAAAAGGGDVDSAVLATPVLGHGSSRRPQVRARLERRSYT